MGFFFYRRAPSPLPSPAAAYPSVVAVLGFVAQSIERLVRSLAQQSSRPFLFTAFTVALLSAKVLHLYAHGKSIIFIGLLVWGPTFFAQDVLLILLARLLAGRFERQRTAIATAVVLTVLSLGAFFMAASNTAFYVATGAEIHWRQAHNMRGNTAAVRTLLSGLTAFLIVGAILAGASWLLANPIFSAVGEVLRVLTCLAKLALSFVRSRTMPARFRPDLESYQIVARADYRDEDDTSSGGNTSEEEMAFLVGEGGEAFSSEKGSFVRERPISRARYLAVSIPILLLVLLTCLRPYDTAYSFLSGTLFLSPFLGGKDPTDPISNGGDLPGAYGWLGNRTALDVPPAFDFLPENSSFPGFQDWAPQSGRLHYNSAKDPLHISNLDQDILEPLREALSSGNVSIKHVILVKLESTRADVFPFHKGSYIWDTISKSFGGHIPLEVEERLANLTRTAELLTGFSSGFDQPVKSGGERWKYGGLSASNAYTTGTYTLKSVVGTVCGVAPMVTDFNREFQHQFYQPCMPHILDVLNEQPGVSNQTDDFKSWPWHSMWMQSVTETYDYQEPLTPAMGFKEIITKESLTNPNASHYPPKSKEINYYGYPDTELRDYLRDAIEDAERDHKRLFISHLTGTTHHPWGIPGGKYDELIKHEWKGRNKDVNKYLNTIGWVDKWLAEILDILAETGVADQTLLVMAGDHGLSLPNDGGITPFDNPHVSSFHVPLLLAHPNLPRIEISDPVISSQILPTILDLLIESSSLEQNSTHATREILGLYEGQSLIRPLVLEKHPEPEPEHADHNLTQRDTSPLPNSSTTTTNLTDGSTASSRPKQIWHFTVMNSGGSWLSLRSAIKPNYRLVIPLVSALEWRFTDLDIDPYEESAIMEFNLNKLAARVVKGWNDGPKRRESAEEVVKWLADAAQVARWWVKENWKLWGHTPGM